MPKQNTKTRLGNACTHSIPPFAFHSKAQIMFRNIKKISVLFKPFTLLRTKRHKRKGPLRAVFNQNAVDQCERTKKQIVFIALLLTKKG